MCSARVVVEDVVRHVLLVSAVASVVRLVAVPTIVGEDVAGQNLIVIVGVLNNTVAAVVVDGVVDKATQGQRAAECTDAFRRVVVDETVVQLEVRPIPDPHATVRVNLAAVQIVRATVRPRIVESVRGVVVDLTLSHQVDRLLALGIAGQIIIGVVSNAQIAVIKPAKGPLKLST